MLKYKYFRLEPDICPFYLWAIFSTKFFLNGTEYPIIYLRQLHCLFSDNKYMLRDHYVWSSHTR